MTELTLRDIKKVSVEFMQAHYGCVDFVIGGGAVRDVMTGRADKINDIDIFMPTLSPWLIDPARDVKKSHIASASRMMHRGLEFNVIYIQGAWSLQDLVDRMDIGLCQTGLLYRHGLQWEHYTSDAFKLDVQHKTLTVTRMTNTTHIDKVQSYFPDHILCNPHGFKRQSSGWFGGYN